MATAAMPPVERLTIVFDSQCGLCANVKNWLSRQVQSVPLAFVAADSPETVMRFPGLPAGELAVVADTGEVWLGNSAWVVCLWALRDYRSWALRLSNPLLLLMAREAFSILSNNRSEVSQWLGLRTDGELEQQFRKVAVPFCVRPGSETRMRASK